MSNFPRVGIGVIVIRDRQVLLGKRKSSLGQNTWGFPGGHLEFGEEIEACALREVKEETGLDITELKRGPYTNTVFQENKHYITLYVIAQCESGEPQVLEPEKCEQWRWVGWEEMPRPLFFPIEGLLEQRFSPFVLK